MIGGRNGRIKGSLALDTGERLPRRDAPKAGRVEKSQGVKDTGHSNDGSCSPSSVKNQGVDVTNLTTEGSEMALSKVETVCEDQGVMDAIAPGRED